MRDSNRRIIVLGLILAALIFVACARWLAPMLWNQANQANYVRMAPARELVQKLTQPQLIARFGPLAGYKDTEFTKYQSPGTPALGQFKRIKVWSNGRDTYLEVWVKQSSASREVGLDELGNKFYTIKKVPEKAPDESEESYQIRWRNRLAQSFPKVVTSPLLGSKPLPIHHVHLIDQSRKELAELWIP